MNALTVAVFGRLADAFGGRDDPKNCVLAAVWMHDGAEERGTDVDGYAAWLSAEMATEGGMDAIEAHCEAIMNRAMVREYQRPKN